jgi:hypothetical protein
LVFHLAPGSISPLRGKGRPAEEDAGVEGDDARDQPEEGPVDQGDDSDFNVTDDEGDEV